MIDLITNLDMAAFQTHGGLSAFINRLEVSKYFGKKHALSFIPTAIKYASQHKLLRTE